MTQAYLAWLGAATVVFIVASTVLRLYADKGSVWLLLAALVLYSVGNLIMVRLMREGGMAVAVSVSAILQLLMVNLVAIVGFGERPSYGQILGIALGLAAIALILLSPRGEA